MKSFFINLKKLDLDNNSFIETSGKIKIGDYSYKNELNKKFILNCLILKQNQILNSFLKICSTVYICSISFLLLSLKFEAGLTLASYPTSRPQRPR